MQVFKQKWTWLLIGSALIVGLLYALPQTFIWRALSLQNMPYVLVQLTHHSDEAIAYLPKAHEVYDGHFPPNDFHFDVGGASPFGPFPIPPLIMGFFLAVFKGVVNQAYIAAHFIVPVILFTLFYLLGIAITKNKLWAWFFGLLGILTPIGMHLPNMFRTFDNFLNIGVKNFFPSVNTPLADLFLARIDDPMLTYLAYIPALILLLAFWKNPNRKSAIFAAIAVGLVFYSYFHYWVYLAAVVGLLLAYAFFTKKRDENRWRSVLFLVFGLVVVTLPYWINYFMFSSLPSADDYANRIGITHGRFIMFNSPLNVIFDYAFYLVLAGLVYWVFYKKPRRADHIKDNEVETSSEASDKKETAVLYWIFIGAMFLVWNVQLITGYVPQPDHWWRTVSLVILVIVFHLAYELSKKINYKFVAVGLVILASLLVAKKVVNALIFINPPEQFLQNYTFDKDIAESWNWINKNLPGEPKIISPSFVTSIYLIGQTSARPYLPIAGGTVKANRELEERFLKTQKVFKVSSATLEKVLRGDYCRNNTCDDYQYFNFVKSARYLYADYYLNDPARRDLKVYRDISEEKAKELLSLYKNLKADWRELDADYVYYGPWERYFTQIDLNTESSLKLVYQNPEVSIYKIIK